MEVLLDRAARRGGEPVLGPNHEAWAVYDGGQLLAAATGAVTVDNIGEMILCGGDQVHRWVSALEARMCDWFRAEGMDRARIYGRKGWQRLGTGWQIIGRERGVYVMERAL